MEYETPTFFPDTESTGTDEIEMIQPKFYPEQETAVTVDPVEFVEPEFYPEEETGGETDKTDAGSLVVPQEFALNLQPGEGEELLSPDENIIPQP